jgi:predicted O-methyltransferase YrrM
MDAPVEPAVLAEVRDLLAPEDASLRAARARAEGVAGLPGPEVGGLLRWAAAVTAARTAVEIGAAGGLSGLWLLQGMDPRGVLTSIEADPHHHGLATAAYAEAGVNERVRSILGDPATVLPRLSDDGYQLCLLQDGHADDPGLLEHALRLLRPGGMLVVRRLAALASGAHADGPATLLAELARDGRLVATVLPLDGGVLLATLAG